MGKRPLSLTIIAWFLVIFALFGLYGAATMGSNPMIMAMIEASGVSLLFQQVWAAIGCLVTLAVAYGIFKGQPWSRVLYVVWGVIGVVVGYFISPMPLALMLSVVFLIVISAFLFRDRANEWFAARGFALHRENG